MGLKDCFRLGAGQQFMRSGPAIYSVTLTNPNGAGGGAHKAFGDIPSGKLKIPARWLMLASEGFGQGALSNSIYLHFVPFGFKYSGNLITPVGTEPWIPIRMAYAVSTQAREGWQMTFPEEAPLTEFWIDYGSESTQIGDFVTFIYSDSVLNVQFPNRIGAST